MKLGYARASTSEQVLDLQLDNLRQAGCGRLDRLGRSTKQLIEVVEDLSRCQLHLISLQYPIDTTSPGGQLVLQIFCALAEHERNVLVQRTRARLGGRKGGRPPSLAPRYQKIAPAV